MIGSIIGGVLNVGSSIAGGIASSRAAKKANNMLAQQKQRNQAWYDRNYNADFTQRSDAQNVINRTREMLQERSQRSAATNAVMGGTDEALAMDKEAQNQAVAQVTSNIASQADNYKDRIEQAYMNNDNALTQQQVGNQQQKAQNISQAVAGASAGAAGIVGSIFDKK